MTSDNKLGQGVTVSEAEITLGVLNAVEQSSFVTQRSLASDLDIALGLANAYLKRCAKKGFIKIQQVPRNRYAYYLTPQGFSEKSRLTAEYLSQSFNFFRSARKQCGDIFVLCEGRGWGRVVLAGAGDLAEIATLCARDHEIEVVGVLDFEEARGSQFAGLPLVHSFDSLKSYDVVMVTDMTQPQAMFDSLTALMPPERVLSPAFLHISRVRPEFAAGDGEEGEE